MYRTIALPVTIVLAFAALMTATPADAKIRVVASLPDLKALTEEVGGNLVDVDGLARGSQNAHDVDVRPSLMVKLRRADLVITNGLELDFWADALIQASNNPELMLGGRGRVDASVGVPVLEVPSGRIDRSMGDVHPQGNPHYTADPETAAVVTANIVQGLARIAPEHRMKFEARRQEFLSKLAAAMARWTKTLEPFRGSPVVVNHNSWIYFLSRFGLRQVNTVEDRPGIPPSPTHVAQLIRQMKEEKIRVLILEPWGDRKLAERIANEAGAKVVLLAHAVGSVKNVDSYLALLEHNVNTVAAALR
jgi:zinc/manganese transport system substrate-binding protein